MPKKFTKKDLDVNLSLSLKIIKVLFNCFLKKIGNII